MQGPIIFEDSAVLKVWQLMTEEENFDLKLRAYVTGGGCSGLQYGFTFDEDIREDDTKIERKLSPNVEVTLLVDSISFSYLQGATISYEENLQGSQFVIRNPNAKTTCGCGSSFSA